MEQKSIESKIKRMSQYLDNEAIARALNIETDLVSGVLNGEAQMITEERRSEGLHITTFAKTSYRQRVIYVARAKGGVGATTVALNLAWRVAEKAKVLVVDTQAMILNETVFSDFLDFARVEPYSLSGSEPGVCELFDNLHYLPYPPQVREYDLDRIVLESRRHYDVIIVDLPDVDNVSVLKLAMVVVYLFSGGVAESARMYRLICEGSKDRESVFVSLIPRHPLSDTAKWIYLPENDKPGAFNAGSPAGKAIAEIVGSIWGREFIEGQRESLIGRFLKRK